MLWLFTFSFSLLLGGKGSLIFSLFYLQPSVAQKLQRLETKLPLSPICNPYYKSTQITQQHKLDVGCYSPEARTSINPMCPPFAQPSEAWHAIREIYCWRLQNPDIRPVCLAGDWLLVLVCSEWKVLLAGWWWLVCSKRKVLLAGGW
jgi:hypothetical protein